MSTHSLPTKLFTTPAAASAKQPSPCLTRFHKNKLKKMFSEMTFYISQWLAAWLPGARLTRKLFIMFMTLQKYQINSSD